MSNDESGTVTAVIPLSRVSIVKIVLEEYRAAQLSTWQVSPRDKMPRGKACTSGFLPLAEKVQVHPSSNISSNSTYQCEAAWLLGNRERCLQYVLSQ